MGELVFNPNRWDFRAWYSICDHPGSVGAVTNEAGEVVALYDHSPYGKPGQTYPSGELDSRTYAPIRFDFLHKGHPNHARSALHFAA